MAFGTTLGAIGSLILQGIGLGLDVQAAEGEQARLGAQRLVDVGRAEKWAQKEFDLRESELDFNRRESRRAWQWKEEDRNYQRGMDRANRLTQILYQNPRVSRTLTDLFGRGRR